jgi:hypothetical protein
MIFGRLLPSGQLTDIQERAQRVYGDGSVDVEVAGMPTTYAAYGYDAVNKLAVASPAISLALAKTAASAAVVDQSAQNLLLRNALRSLLTLNRQIVQFLQANIAALPAGSLPTVPTWAQAITVIRNQIASENDPNT